ncbi:MAG TPA: GTPase [Candidatus Nanoarchaeia archaeon]|nr:GTPase [Candidatus Nanoarchaeia archaeon]
MRVRYSFSSRKTGTIEGTNKHKKPVPHIVKEVIRISDVILEVLDARFIEETRNRELEALIREGNKVLIYVVNKADLVDIREVKRRDEFKAIKPYVFFSCTSLIGRKRLRDMIKICVKRLAMKRQAHVGIIGYPNTGKSSLINLLTGRKAMGTSSVAGFTKGMQKIRFTKDILILDTPGIIPLAEESILTRDIVKKHATIGIGRYDRIKDPEFVVARLMQEYPGMMEEFYSIDANGDAEILLLELGRKRNLLSKGGQIDIDRTARLVLKDWQENKKLKELRISEQGFSGRAGN